MILTKWKSPSISAPIRRELTSPRVPLESDDGVAVPASFWNLETQMKPPDCGSFPKTTMGSGGYVKFPCIHEISSKSSGRRDDFWFSTKAVEKPEEKAAQKHVNRWSTNTYFTLNTDLCIPVSFLFSVFSVCHRCPALKIGPANPRISRHNAIPNRVSRFFARFKNEAILTG